MGVRLDTATSTNEAEQQVKIFKKNADLSLLEEYHHFMIIVITIFLQKEEKKGGF